MEEAVLLLVVPVVPVVAVVVLAVLVLVLAVEVELVELIGTCMLERGVKAMGELIPVDAIAAVICRLKVELASSTRTSTTTSARGLSRSLIIFSTKDMRSPSHLAMMAFCAL
jgi:hypothetical protein